MIVLVLIAWAILGFPTGVAAAQSQASTGQIAGRVVDPSGAIVTGVTVNISSPSTGVRRDVVTNPQGIYVAPLLPPGIYDLSVEVQGFAPVRAAGLHVTVGSALTVDVAMQTYRISETLDVVGGATLLEITGATPTTTFNATWIEKLPMNGRRFQDLVVLTPHAQVDIQRGQIAISGQRGINSGINIDGADYTQPFFAGIRGGSRSNFAPTVPQEAIREFQVIAAGYSAEFGRSSGGLVNVATKSGTNRTSGTAFYVNRHRKLAADNIFGQPVAPTQHQWGGSFGAPIRRDRSFVFLAYEQQEVDIPRAVLFDALQAFTPTPATREAFDHFKSLEGPYTETNDALTFLARIDWQMTSGRRLEIRESSSRNVGLNAISPGNAAFATVPSALSHNGTEKDRTDTVVAQFTDARRSNLLFEIRGQYSREDRPRYANAIEPRVQTGIGRFGTVAFLGERATVTIDSRSQALANVTRIAGAHSVKAGGELNFVRVDQRVGLNQTGNFVVSGSNAATILELLSAGGPNPNRFDSTTVTYTRQIGNLQQAMSTEEVALFLQDSWRLAPTVTLTYGLRWEGQWNPAPQVDDSNLVDRLVGFTFPSGRQVDPYVIPDALEQVAPRAGVAWAPGRHAKTVVRGSAGVYYARSPGLILAGPQTNFRVPPADLSVQLPFSVPTGNPNTTVYRQLALIGIDLNRTPLDSLPILTPEQIVQIAEVLGLPFGMYTGARPILVDPDFKNPRTFQWGFGVERAIAPGLSVGGDYSDLDTVHLERNIDLNLPLPYVRDGDVAQRPFFGLRSGRERPIASLGEVIVRESTARSHYRGLTLRTRLQKRWGELSAFYVISKSLSDDDNEADIGGMVAENAYNLAPEYSYARLDRRHQFSGGWMLFLPFGLEAAGSFQLRSGVPIDAGVGNDANEDLRSSPDRPFSAPGVPYERNRFRNRPTSTVNLHVRKTFAAARRRQLSIVMDVFNVFNADGLQYAGAEVTNYCAASTPTCGFDAPSNPNFLQVVDRNPTSPRFGSYLLNNTPGEPRQVQVGVRVSF